MKQTAKSTKPPKTSWEKVAGWYQDYMGAQGGGYQRDVIFPGALRLLEPRADGRYLDLACGQGAFAKLLAKTCHVKVVGVDASPSLIKPAQKNAPPSCEFLKADARAFAALFDRHSFDGAACLLSIQNIDDLGSVLRDACCVLRDQAPFVIVLNHPCFRQPRQSGWGWDEKRKLQYRRVDRYLTPYEMPIEMHPGAAPQLKTYSYHRPISTYVTELTAAGFVVDALEEWVSPKTRDSGPRARAENVARAEIPLFLALRSRLMHVTL